MVLRLRPELVKRVTEPAAVIDFDSAFYCPDFERPSRVDVPRRFDQLSKTGAFGHPEIGSDEKGEALYTAAAREVIAFVREFARWKDTGPA